MEIKAKDYKEYIPKVCPSCGITISEDPLQCDWPKEVIIFYPASDAPEYWHKTCYEESRAKSTNKFDWEAYYMKLRQNQIREIEFNKNKEK